MEKEATPDAEKIFNSSEWRSLPLSSRLQELIESLLYEAVKEKAVQANEQQARLLALQSQINSHFLYNTLECIRSEAIIEGNRDIADMLETLSSFFRYSISRKVSVVTLLDELVNSRKYMKIQQYRFGSKYILEEQIGDNDPSVYNCFVPKLMFQPIIENAMLHAFNNKKYGRITVSVDSTEELIVITVSDDGDGMTPEILEDLTNFINGKSGNNEQGFGIALANVENRIKMLFGKEYGINVYSTQHRGTDVEITLPRTINRESIRL